MTIALITGARGFVGRHLARSLQNKGIRVCGLGHGIWTELEREEWGLDYWLNGDVTKRNLEIIQEAVGKPDVAFHLAGGSSVGPSMQAPEEDFRRSVLSASELLEWTRLSAPDASLVLASSAAVYGSGHTDAISESALLSPYSPYGAHKRMAEELFESYSNNFGLNVSVVRLFSVYGTELRKQLLWDVCCRLTNDATHLELGGSGHEMRDWFHISDAANLLQLVAAQEKDGVLIVNGGTGNAVTVRQVAEQLCAAWGEGTQLSFSGKGRAGDPQYLVADTERAAELGFVSNTKWEEGLKDYVAWFKRVNMRKKG